MKKQPSSSGSSLYFEIQSEMGATKHLGGQKATDEILELCNIEKAVKILEVGCGAGLSTRYIAKKYDVEIVGVDISEKMIDKAKKRNKGLENAEFLVADAQKLPFEDDTFDIVFTESVVSVVPNQLKAIKEFKRVVKPGGYVGLNEVTWAKDPPKRLLDYLSMTVGDAKMLRKEGYAKLLSDAGLKNITARTRKIELLEEIRENMRRFSFREYPHAWFILIKGLLTNAKFRKYAWDAMRLAPLATDIFKYWQIGIYIGRK
jgi:ubiquinone/menaquinone biosynthesis C-methylase UbiE